MARKMRSGTGVGPGICRKWRPARRGALNMQCSPSALSVPSLKQAPGTLPTRSRQGAAAKARRLARAIVQSLKRPLASTWPQRPLPSALSSCCASRRRNEQYRARLSPGRQQATPGSHAAFDDRAFASPCATRRRLATTMLAGLPAQEPAQWRAWSRCRVGSGGRPARPTRCRQACSPAIAACVNQRGRALPHHACNQDGADLSPPRRATSARARG